MAIISSSEVVLHPVRDGLNSLGRGNMPCQLNAAAGLPVEENVEFRNARYNRIGVARWWDRSSDATAFPRIFHVGARS